MTQHSIPLTKCKAELTAQYAFKTYDTYAFTANLGNLGSWQSVYTQLWHQKPLCIDSVLKHCAANRKRQLSALPNVGPYIYNVSISGFTRSSIYIYIYIYMTLVG